jgi:hypothetical protein
MSLDVMTIVLLILMATGQSIITDASEKLVLLGQTGIQIAGFQSALGLGLKALFIVLIVVSVVDLVQSVVKMVRNKQAF